MKTIKAILCLLWLARVCGFAQPSNINSLPIGSRAVISNQLQNVTCEYRIRLFSNPYCVYGIGQYGQSISLDSLMRISILSCFENYFSGISAGRSVGFWCYLVCDTNQWTKLFDGEDEPDYQIFVTQFDSSGDPIIPFQQLLYPSPNRCDWNSWSLSKWLPVIGAATNVERVDYVLKTNGLPVLTTSTLNGATGYYTNVPCLRDGNLYLDVEQIDASCIPANFSKEVVLWYSVSNGLYVAFDVSTGQKIRSTPVTLKATKTNGLQCVTLKGWPGKQVIMQTSTNLKSWTDKATVRLDTAGNAVFFPTNKIPFFVRGRLLSP